MCRWALNCFTIAPSEKYKAGALPSGTFASPPFFARNGRTEQNSRSSHEDDEKGSRVDLNANISARSVRRCCRGLCWRLTRSSCRIKNSLTGVPKAQFLSNVKEFANQKELTDFLPLLKKRALVAQDPPAFEKIEELDEDEKVAFRREITRKWSQPHVLYLTIIPRLIGAAVQYVSCGFSRFIPLIAYIVLAPVQGLGSDRFERRQLIFLCRF